jgi:hypothetical protein
LARILLLCRVGGNIMNRPIAAAALSLATLCLVSMANASEPDTNLNATDPADPAMADGQLPGPPEPPVADEVVEEDEDDESIADFRIDGGAGVAGTSWRGDVVGFTNVRIGVRFIDLIAPYAGVSVGYGSVDQRMLTMISLGAQVWAPEDWPLRLYGRVAAVHQHEESISVIAGDFGNALFGVGDGIRHRPGAEVGGGVDVPIFEKRAIEIYGLLDASARIFPDEMGPQVYGGGGFNLGMNYEL